MDHPALASLAADGVVLVHLAFILFVALGGLLVARRITLAWLHVPAVAWAVAIELAGWTCPLTPLENRLRQAAGEAGYASGFVDHYVVPIIYPPGLTPAVQIAIGLGVLALNLLVYAWTLRRR